MDEHVKKFYAPILGNAGLVFDNEGFISIVGGDTTLPFIVEDKRWVLPYRARLCDKNIANTTIFHPLNEASNADTSSQVLSRLRIAYSARINFQLVSLLSVLVTIATSPAMHQQLEGDQRDILKLTADATESLAESFSKLKEVLFKMQADKSFVTIFLKRQAIIKGKTFIRGAMVHWPLYKELCSEEKKVFGVVFKKKDKELLKAIVEHLVPGIDVEGQYCFGSLHQYCPFVDALLQSVSLISDSIVNMAQRYKDLVDIKLFHYDGDWKDVLDNYDKHLPIIKSIGVTTPEPAPVTQAVKTTQPLTTKEDNRAQPQQQELSILERVRQNQNQSSNSRYGSGYSDRYSRDDDRYYRGDDRRDDYRSRDRYEDERYRREDYHRTSYRPGVVRDDYDRGRRDDYDRRDDRRYDDRQGSRYGSSRDYGRGGSRYGN